MHCLTLLLLSLTSLSLFFSGSAASVALFHRIVSDLCINAEFAETHSEVRSIAGCAILCNLNQRCQAFSLTDGPCQLFVFYKCSKSVKDCGCSRRGQVFVKRRPGLAAGALCPSGYGDELCGVRYKRLGGGGSMNWNQGKQACDSENGLVIMADVTSAEEMSHIDSWYPELGGSPTPHLWLGGFQLPGSPEPGGGWRWISCDVGLNASLWGPGQPNNHGGVENLVIRYNNVGITDAKNQSANRPVLCECLHPF